MWLIFFYDIYKEMPKNSPLTDFERAVTLREQGLTLREISLRIGRSKDVVHNYLRMGDKYATKKRIGRPSSLTPTNKREIKPMAIHQKLSSAEIKAEMNLVLSVRWIRQVLSEDPNISFTKTTPVPRLLPRHKKDRFAFAKKYRFWNDEWSNVVFSDEKKFNLDGPDSFTSR